MQVTNGTGKLYDASEKQVTATVSYQIREDPQTGGWSGELSLNHEIWPLGKYILKLADGRKGTCFVLEQIEQESALPTIRRYSFMGSGSLL